MSVPIGQIAARIGIFGAIASAIECEIKDRIGVLSACPTAGEKVKFAALNNRIAFL
jgi:hypothetical protein